MKKREFVIAGIVLMCLTAFALIRYYRSPVVENTAIEKSEKDFTVAIGAGLTSSADNKSAPLRRVDIPIRLKIIDINNVMGIVTISDVLFAAALSIAFILGIYLGIHVIRERMNRPNIYSPYEIAVKSLAEIDPEKAHSAAALKELYFKISRVIRGYLKESLNFGKAELTSREFLVKLDTAAVIPNEAKDAAKSLIVYCDFVKFSGNTANMDEFKAHFDTAKNIINEINRAATIKGDNK